MPKRKPRYQLILEGPRGKTVIAEPPSVTEIIHKVFSDSFAPGAWWGMKVAAGALNGRKDLNHPDVLADYEKMKKTKITPNTIRDEAGERGILAHDVAEQLAKGELEPDDVFKIYQGAGDGYVRAAAQWFADQKGEWELLGTEVQVIHRTLDYVGTLDYLRRPEIGHEEIIDWKTSKPPVRSIQHMQLAAYDLALGGAVRRHRVVLFGPNGTYFESTNYIDPTDFVPVKEVYDTIKRWEESVS